MRPTIVIGEPEPEQALSTRKLVLETAKFNVLTTHSAREFMDVIRRFPSADCAILHGLIGDGSCERMLREAKKINPRITTVFLAARVGGSCKGADHIIPSHQPEVLLELVRKLFGDPRSVDGSTRS